MVALCAANPAQFQRDPQEDKIRLLDNKFRTKVALQPTAFVHQKVEDGVELGCYGYYKDDQPYRIYFIKDVKDYRLITTTMKFLVYPTSDKKR